MRFFLLLLLVAGCTSVVEVHMPYCPVSDSAWKHADSIPAICVFDTVSAKRRKP